MVFRNKILMLLAIAVWLFPSLANASASVADKVQPMQASTIITIGPAIAVSTAASPAVVADMPAALSACVIAPDQAALLNQPATCFNLAVGHIADQPSVQVARLPDMPSVRVAETPFVRILPYHLLPAIPDTSAPVLPWPFFGGAIIFIASIGTAFTAKRVKNLVAQFNDQLSLSQLQMMRC